MKIILFLILSLLVEAQTLKIASYNVENLFDMQQDGNEYVEYIPGHHGWSQRMLDIKLQNITEVICDMEADVIGLQEVENDNVLSQLQRSLERAGCRYRYRAITTRPDTPVHNALLSKVPIKKKSDLLVTQYGHQRSILEVTLDTSPPLRVFVNHWKSKRGPESERIVYAKALKKRLDRLPSGSEYVLIGDFNSNYNESLTMDKKHNDTGGITGINHILHTTRPNGQMVRIGDIKSGEMANLWMELPAGSRWSHNFFGDKEGIDAIIIPPTLRDKKGWEYVPESFGVYKASYLFGYHGRIKRWGYKHGKHTGKGYSDHLPVYAMFSNEGKVGTKGKNKSEKSWWDRFLDIFSPSAEVNSKPQTTLLPVTLVQRAEKQSTGEADIAEIKKRKKIDEALLLPKVCVVFKRGDSAVIRQSADGEGILLYRSALQLEEGREYDLKVYKKKRYKGMDELTDVEVVRDLGKCDMEALVPAFEPRMMNDESFVGIVVKNLSGVVDGQKIKIDNREYPIHFRRKAGRPLKGSMIRIEKAMIGYYKDHMEIVVWEKRDWK